MRQGLTGFDLVSIRWLSVYKVAVGTMQQFWIFGYGSLMWRPGFAFAESEPALIKGVHRKLCVMSHVHRGTPEMPGLVLGLDRGGSCHGMAFRIAPERWDGTLAYLRSREQVTMVYLERHKPIRLLSSGRSARAVTYVVDRAHKQYAGKMDAATVIGHVRQGQGISGACIDYVLNTVAHLREMNIHDEHLERIAEQVRA